MVQMSHFPSKPTRFFFDTLLQLKVMLVSTMNPDVSSHYLHCRLGYKTTANSTLRPCVRVLLSPFFCLSAEDHCFGSTHVIKQPKCSQSIGRFAFGCDTAVLIFQTVNECRHQRLGRISTKRLQQTFPISSPSSTNPQAFGLTNRPCIQHAFFYASISSEDVYATFFGQACFA